MGLHIHFLPEFKSQPSMIAGLPDMGNVAGIGLNFLSRKLNAQLFAEIHSYWPPFITYNNGIIDYSQASYKFYFVEKYNIIIFTGEFNPSDPSRLYEIVNEVLKMAERFNIKTLYSIGAAFKQQNITAPNALYIVTNNPEFLNLTKNYNISILDGHGQIFGFNGLIIGLAKEKGIDGICILGEIDNPNIIQPKTVRTILNTLIKIFDIEYIDMKELDDEEDRKNFMQQQMTYFEKALEYNKTPGIA